jgi:hypothetical protein
MLYNSFRDYISYAFNKIGLISCNNMMDKCCTCKENGKFVDHLLLHCDVAYSIFFFQSVWVVLGYA